MNYWTVRTTYSVPKIWSSGSYAYPVIPEFNLLLMPRKESYSTQQFFIFLTSARDTSVLHSEEGIVLYLTVFYIFDFSKRFASY